MPAGGHDAGPHSPPLDRRQIRLRLVGVYDGELLVSRSTTPEFDAARALLAKGITGKLTLLDGKTGRPRLTLDIEKCAKLTVRDDRRRGPCFVKWTPMPSDAHEIDEGEPPAGEEALVVPHHPT